METKRRGLLLGAATTNDMVVDQPAVSSHHAALWQERGVVWIADLGSTNGTFVDEQRLIGQTPVRRTSRVRFGAVPVDVAFVVDRLAAAPEAVLVGRDASCDVVLDVPVVSSRHLLLLRRPGGVSTAVDLCSSNGTSLGQHGARLQEPAQVSGADVLFLGSYRLPVATLDGPAGGRTSLSDRPLIAGRDPSCDLVVPSPQVSARHAQLTPQPDGSFRVQDLGSTNGTYVDGVRVVGALETRPGAVISLGSVPLRLDGAGHVCADGVRGTIRLDGIGVKRVVKHRQTGAPLTLLDDVTVSVYPGELVGLMGPSGAGKTTMMLAFNGYERPTEGQVLINGEDLYTNYDRYRGLIGYVPQDDIIHGQLTVRESLYYTARLRLPPDTTDAEIEARIDDVLRELKLEPQRDQVIGTVEQKVLSGGQRKRVNLAQELVTDPVLLFLDEPTSGLSAKDTADVMEVLRRLADSGRTILLTIHQPSHDVYTRMDHVLLLAEGGRLAYFGPTAPDSYTYFGAPDREPDRVMVALEEQEPAAWQQRYRSSDHHGRWVQGRLSQPSAPDTGAIPARRPRTRWLRQGWTLTRRYLITKIRDRGNLVLLGLQAPVVIGLLALMFGDCRDAAEGRHVPLFVMVIAAIFFGSFNASREIVSERAIYRRERMVNLAVVPYVFSKFFPLTLVGLAQVGLLYGLAVPALGLDGSPLTYLVVLLCTVLASTAMGLVLSSVVRSTEAAMALVPIILIPQMVLSGYLVSLDKNVVVEALAVPILARWSVEGLLDIEREALETAEEEEPPTEVGPPPGAQFRQLMEDRKLTPERWFWDATVLGGFATFFLSLTLVLVRFKDRKL